MSHCFPRRMGKLFSKSKTPKSSTNNAPEAVNKYAHVEEEKVTMGCFREYSPAHDDGVMSVAFVKPGLALSGSKDKNLILFDFTSGEKQQVWSGHDREITKVRYGEEVNAFFSASRDKTICMWKCGQVEPVKQFIGHDLVVNGLTINKENTNICTGSRDNSVRIWDVETGQCKLQNVISRNLVTDVCWGKDSHMIVQTGEDKEVRLWDSRTLQVCVTFPRKLYIQNCCDMSDDNNFCITCSNGFGGSGCEATLWDIRAGQPLCEFKGHQESIGACLFLPSSISSDQRLIATCSNDCTVKLWDINTKACVSTLSLSGSGPLTSLAVDQEILCVGSMNLGVNVIRVSSANEHFDIMRIAQY